MKIFIVTIGSRGDVQPFVALGRGFAAAGRRVTLCTHARFEAFVADHGLAFAPLDDGLLALLDTDAGRRFIERRAGAVEALRDVVGLWRRAGPLQRRMLEDGWQAARRAEPDVVVFHPKAYGGAHYAAMLGVPAVLAFLQPLYAPTAAWPAMGFPELAAGGRVGALYNRLTHRLVRVLASAGMSGYVRAWRAAHGLPRVRSTDLLRGPDGRPLPVLHAFSPHVVPPPPDGPETVRTTGFWFLNDVPAPPGAALPPELRAWLGEGPPPVYVGFGSMSGRDPEATTGRVLRALAAAGVRGLLAAGWGGLTPGRTGGDLPETVRVVDAVPHEALFPHVAAVVHHGGAGTTAAGLRAGRPTVVCPFFGDQPFWGRRVHALGCGPAPLPQRRLTADALAEAIRHAVGDEATARRAAAVGAAIRAEDGVGRAVAAVERVVRAGAP